VNKRREKPSIPGGTEVEDADRQDPDRTLVERARKGDREAFRQLFQKYHRRAYALAFGVVHNADDALDVVQEAFLKAHRHLHNFEGAAGFFTWLYRIVMNVAIDHLRKQGRVSTVNYDDAVAHLEDAPAASEDLVPRVSGGNPHRELARQDLREKIDAALERLSPNHRAVLVMREIEGLSYEEMAQAMKCSKGTIMSRLFHARRYMQKHILELFGGKKDFVP
jgi:RNA polymerase sigma-70 factor (ECF subfamily)